jgi:hypothetical protein
MVASRVTRLLGAAALALVCVSRVAAAQTAATGNVEGVVTDPTGGVLPGVTITVRNIDTNAARETVSGAEGRYRVAALQPGQYEILATLSGFDMTPVPTITVQVGQTVAVDVGMRPAGVTETLTVTAEAPAIDVRRTDVSNVVSETAIENLPVVGRRWDNFVLLSPGVTNDGNFGLVSYRGVSGLYNNNMVDGVDNNQAFFSEARGRTRIAYSISEAAIKEFQVGVSNMSAEFGRAAGGTVNAVTKSGGNTFSGEGFYFFRHKAFQSRNPRIVLPDPEAKPDDTRQQFGLSLGGPLRRDKAFFFLNYDQQVRNFPIFAAPSGANFFTQACTAPAASCAATIAFYRSLNVLSPRDGDNKVGLGKVDVHLNSSNLLSVSYNIHRWESSSGIQTQPLVSVAESANGDDIVKTDFLVTNLNTVISDRWLNELRVQVGRDFEEQTPNGEPPSTTITNGISFGRPNFLPRAAYPHEQRYQFIDALSYYRGNHNIKMGLDINFVKEKLINLFNGGGTYSYTSLTNMALDCPIGATGCTPAATAPAGRHYSNYTQAFDLNNLGGALNFNEWMHNFYIQDTWRVNNALVVNAGVRYEYQQLPQPGEVSVSGVTFAGNPAYPLTQRFHQDTNNFAPRIGVTYDVGGRHTTVIRGSYGLFHALTSNSSVANALTNNGINQASYFITPSTPGAPAYPTILSAPPNIAGNRPDLNVLDPDLQRPAVHMADLAVDRELGGDATLSVSYLYSHGVNLPVFMDNNLNPANSQVTYVLDGQPVGTFPLYRGSRPDGNVGRILTLVPSATSDYHALVLQAHKRFSNGLLYNLNYTLAKSTDTGQNSTTFFAFSPSVYDSLDPTLGMEGPSDTDRRHRFVGSFYYRPELLRGFGVSGIVTLESGLPINETISGSLSAAVGSTVSSSTNGSGGSNIAPWLGRNTRRQDGRKTVDLRASHQFDLGGERKVELLWEVFNVFNWINYTGASSTAFNVASSSYNAATNTATVNLTRNDNFLVPTSIGNTLFGMRDMQFGLKFIW